MLFCVTALFFVFLYAILIFYFYLGWKKLPESKDLQCINTFISVIIAARNEEKNLPYLLHSLQIQDYPVSQYEIIIVNDHSEDNTASIIKKHCNSLPNLKLLNLPDEQFGKKAAIDLAVNNAAGNLIACTDADCTIGKNWLATIACQFESHKPKLIIGPVLYNFSLKKPFEILQALENISLSASGAGAAAQNRAILCNGANMAFEKAIYFELKNYTKPLLASGDDMFLLEAVKKRWPKSILQLKSKHAAVYTFPAKNFNTFMQQRIRWASKNKYYNSTDIIITALIIGITNLLLASTYILLVFLPSFWLLALSLFIIKTLADGLILWNYAKFYKQLALLKYLIPVQIVFPFYVVIIACISYKGVFNWKNRQYN